tara:strand:+ start:440 stop:994 length:555 start_codon:yes stop_codon:yes gene_type:complete
MSNNKTCTRCGEEKPATLEYFYKKRGNRLRADCKVCVGERSKAHYKANKEVVLGRQKAYREANKEVVLGIHRAYREANKEAIAEYGKAYYRTPRRKWTMIRSAAKRRNINFSLPSELYESQLWGKPCHYCGCDLEVTGLDRKDSDKGYTPDNVVPCCADCNVKKSTKPYEQFIQEQKEAEGNNK